MNTVTDSTSTTTTPLTSPSSLGGAMTSLSPEALLAYCEIQLGSLDGQITTQMTVQEDAAREREAINNVKTTLGKYGTDGPQNADSMQVCIGAIDSAISNLGPADPVAAQLASFRDSMIHDYGFVAPRELTSDEKQHLIRDQGQIDANTGDDPTPETSNNPNPVSYQQDLDMLTSGQGGSFTSPTDGNAISWQARMDQLNNIDDNTKSSAEVQMLTLQDLVSQRQQAVSLTTNMMSKEDQSLEEEAKAIGR